jgi:prevent-host-death family protein
MEQQIGITEARNRIGELVDMVRYRGDTVVLVKSGKPAAAIVPVEWLERYRKERAAAFATVTQVQAQNEDVSEEELQLLLDESIREVRKEAHRE